MLTQLFISALMLVESGGNAGAIGDGGRALGCLQIHVCVIDDVNNRLRRSGYAGQAVFKHTDALDPVKAAKICRLYIEAYAPPNASLETCARIWNGGPDGHRKKSTLKYWQKVEAKYHELAEARKTLQARK